MYFKPYKKAYVFAALLEYAIANYLNRQRSGILFRNSVRTSEISRYIENYLDKNNLNCSKRKRHHHSTDSMVRRLSAQQRINIEGRSWNSPVKKRKNFTRSTIYTNNIEG